MSIGARRNDAPVEILDYRAELRAAFESLNREWLEQQFSLEAADRRILSDPEGEILARGGSILFARLGDEIVGTVGLQRVDAHHYEVVKMAVTARAQGRGIGQALLAAAVARAREAGAERLSLETNSGLAPALHIYRKAGFRVSPAGPGDDYRRADLAMELELEPR